MRQNQITIKIQRFGASAPDGNSQTLTIYADANGIYEALCAAFYECLAAIKASTPLPSFGRRGSYEGGTEKLLDPEQWDGRDSHVNEE